MYQILIVDDEQAEREVISFLLNKYDFPLQITEAPNGRTALELLEKKSFDILFTDIKMPFMGGLELAARAREHFPEMSIIFFSGYDDFEYVKEALSLHVVNYILKPVNPDEFQKTIAQVIDQIRRRETLSLQQKATEGFARNHMLYQLINNVNIHVLMSQYPHMDFSFAYAYHRLFLIQLEKDYFGSDAAGEDDVSPLNLQGFLPQGSDFINLNPAQSLILFSGQKHRFEWYEQQAAILSALIRKQCRLECAIAISSPFQGPGDISSAYAEAERILEQRFFFTNRALYGGADDEKGAAAAAPVDDDEIIKQIEKDIQFKDAFSLKQNVTLLLNTYKAKTTYSHIYIRFLCTRLVKTLLDGLPGESAAAFDSLAKRIYDFRHFSEIEAIIMELTDALLPHLEQAQQSPRHAVQLVKQYIYSHYGEDLCLNLLADKVYLTPRYLSTMFIQETGCGINKFIKNVRMEKARELLLNTNMKINDICKKVGYGNVSYFCKSFMEDSGTTPDRFRRQKDGDGPERNVRS